MNKKVSEINGSLLKCTTGQLAMALRWRLNLDLLDFVDKANKNWFYHEYLCTSTSYLGTDTEHGVFGFTKEN
jgi:hypothetical protein